MHLRWFSKFGGSGNTEDYFGLTPPVNVLSVLRSECPLTETGARYGAKYDSAGTAIGDTLALQECTLSQYCSAPDPSGASSLELRA